MPILAIATQPAANSLQAAYRPIVFKVNANANSVTYFPAQIELIAGHTINIYAPSQTIIDFLANGNQIVMGGTTSNSGVFTITNVVVSIASTTGIAIYTLNVTETVISEEIAFRTIKNNNNLVASPAIVYCDIYFNAVYYKSISKTVYESLLPNGTPNQFNATVVIVNNGDGTQTVNFTFDAIPGSPASLNIISTPIPGGIPVSNSGAPTSTRSVTQAVGNYSYTFQVYFGVGIDPLVFMPAVVQPYSVWSFDIQDAIQEILGKSIGINGGGILYNPSIITSLIYCKFRVCGYDANGFISSEVSAPIQASGKLPSINGGGTQSNSFYVLNSSLQHINNQDLATHLSAYFVNTRGISTWNNAYPVTHRPAKYPLSLYDSDYYPFIYMGATVNTSILRIKYKIKGLNVYKEAEVSFVYQLIMGSIYGLANGPKNLKVLFPGIEWLQIDEYFLELWTAAPLQILSTNANSIKSYTDNSVRLHFLNYLGTYDAVTFNRANIEHEDSASSFQKTLSYPLSKTDASHSRLNLKSNDTYEVRTIDYLEADQAWLKELKDSPSVFIEWTGIEGQADDYLPVSMETGKVTLMKNTINDFIYEFGVKFKLSNEYIIIRS